LIKEYSLALDKMSEIYESFEQCNYYKKKAGEVGDNSINSIKFNSPNSNSLHCPSAAAIKECK
jgi:hypothetical protein